MGNHARRDYTIVPVTPSIVTPALTTILPVTPRTVSLLPASVLRMA